jgi:DNA-binding response OmpR family regulator
MAEHEIRILAVDDMPEILVSLNEILGDIYEMHLAKTATAAMNILRAMPIDMMLLDIEMPNMSGLDFIRLIREDTEFKKIPVIMISANSQRMNVEKSLKAGALDYIVKPINAHGLREKLFNYFIEHKTSRRTNPGAG